MRFHFFSLKWAVSLLAASLYLLATAAFADHLMITRNFSGAWAHPDHQSQGIMLHITEQPEDSKFAVVHWFTFGNDLESSWFVAAGLIEGHEIHMTLYSASGVGFLEPDAPDSVPVEAIGTLLVSFHNCNQGSVFFDTPEEMIGAGEFRIRRLTSLYNSRCSGGISDDTPSDKRPAKLEVRLHPARDDIAGEGKAMFWERADRSDFKVHVEGMPDNTYDLLVCELDVGDLEVTGGEGSLEFRSPGIDSKLLLDFEPEGCRIDLEDESGIALSSGDAVLSAKDHGSSGDHGPGNVGIDVDLTSTGVIADAEGDAQFVIHGINTEFEVRIENVPAGFYPLLVAGVEEGQIEVIEDDGKFKGKLRFVNPSKVDAETLDFNPRGEVVEVLQGVTVILESLFPDE